MDTDVLIVGAGPTGLMLANQLGRRGIRARIVDRHTGPSLETRALGVQARTLEIYSHLGIAEQALQLGKRATGANMWAQGRRRTRLPLGDIGRDLSPYPFLLILGQDDNERLLAEALKSWGMMVEWNTELIGLAQNTDYVIAKLRQSDGTIREVTAAWVAGCDGARSAVREMNGIGFQGAPYDHVFYVADTQMTGPMMPEELNVYLWRDGFHLFFPMRGNDHWRVVGILPSALRGRDDVTFDQLFPSIRQQAGAGLSLQGCSWFSTYRIHHRRAERFRDGHCFLLGDAAHIHSPVGAQGMNTGLQDAYNLAWKLALVISGQAGARLLDSYEDERIPVAKRLLSTTDRAFTVIVSDTKLAGLFRTRIMTKLMALAMRLRPVRELAFRTISQTGIAYPNSSLSEALPGLPEGAPRPGDRFPWLRLKLSSDGPAEDFFGKLDDTRFSLILIGQSAPPDCLQGLGDLLRTYEVLSDPANDRELARAHIPELAFYLLRPDGHIGLAGSRLESGAVKRYLSDRLNLRVAGDIESPRTTKDGERQVRQISEAGGVGLP
jgi:2-polyprenyl-6-methoxyphenol hydroxylase-like FAD-dependent oxidoreductase